MISLRILIAEDEAIIRLDLKEMLTELGHEVVAEAWTGDMALDMVRGCKPDLAILDIKMPGKNGIEVASEITASGYCPVIMLTAYSQKTLVAEAVKAGAMAYLVKPFDKSDLLPAIEISRTRFSEARDLEVQVKDLEKRLEVRKLVERAKGILMREHGYDEAAAFKQLQKWSMDRRVSLEQISESVVKKLG